MPVIRFIEGDGTEHRVDAANGTSAMFVAVDHGVPGIEGDCGGSCACGTCHVFVDEAWREAVGERSEQEEAMLTCSPVLADNSRLCCQIVMSEKLDGLVLHLPNAQH
jgi:2Fe-2S ferredoxin